MCHHVSIGSVPSFFSSFLPKQESCYDGVFISHVIEHYVPRDRDAETILSLCHEALVPGGRIVIVTPNPVNLFVITENFWKDPSHVRPYPIDALKVLLTKCGFDVVQAGWDTDTVSQIPEEAKTPAWHDVGRILGHFFYCEDAYAVGEKPV